MAHKWFRRAPERQQVAAPEPAGQSDDGLLILLVPDATRLGHFRPHSYGSIKPAAELIRSLYLPGSEHRLIAFWALHSSPLQDDSAEEIPAEAVLLIRDNVHPGLVSLFSFVDMESALEFLRSEAVEGLELDRVLLYWAVSLTIEHAEDRSVRLYPETPPPVQPVVLDEAPAEGEAEGESLDAYRATDLDQLPAEEPPIVQDLVAEEVEAPVEAEEEPVTELSLQGLGLETVGPELEAMAPMGEGPPIEDELATPTPATEDAPPASPAEAEVEAAPPEPSAEEHQEEEATGDVLARSKALRVKRWETHEGPFRGFDSPPGKF